MRKSTNQLICFILIFGMISQSFASWPQNKSNPTDSAISINPQDLAEAQLDATQLANAITEIENGSLKNRSIQEFDQFRLANQSIIIFDKNGSSTTYQLNDFNVRIPQVIFTDLKIHFDETKNELIFEALVGANKNGENGTVVARQIIPNMKIAALVRDPEIISFIDDTGRLHAIDFGYLTEQVFKSPIPVFQNLWMPTKTDNHTISRFKLKYLTLGTKPYSEQEINESSILPLDPKGRPLIKAGDLAIEGINTDTNERQLVGIFSRSVMHEQMAIGSQQLQLMSMLLNPDNEKIQSALDIIQKIEQNEKIANEQDLDLKKMPLVIKKVFQQLRTSQLQSLDNANQNNLKNQKRVTGQLDLKNWHRDYQTIYNNMIQQQPDIDESLIEKNWPQGVKPLQGPVLLNDNKKQSRISKTLIDLQTKKNLNRLSGLFAGLGLSYLVLPYAIDHSTTVEQIKTISWIYENFYPAILKDSMYRTPLLLSTVSLIAIWPVSVALSAVAGKAFNTLSDRLQNSQSEMARKVRDIAKKWGPLNDWQRITTYGLRLYAWLMYPYWRVIASMLRQKTFFTALENGINPFTLIKKKSELGQKFNLERDVRIGLNNIFAKQADLDQKTNLNVALISAKTAERKKIENMAWALATIIVSEKNGFDPATLALLAEEKIQINQKQINQILSDPKIKKQWELTADRILSQSIQFIESGDLTKTISDSELLSKMYENAQQIADEIKKQPELIQKLNSLRYAFKNKARRFNQAALKIGVEEHAILKSVIASEDVAKQVKQEFTIDHLMVVLIVGFYGERTDLSNPSQLAADPKGFLWTSQAHWNDIFLNTFAHFFVSGSNMVLVLQKMKSHTAQSYRPIEDFLYVSRDRAEPFFTGTKNWIKEVANPIKADLGSIMIKRFNKKFQTFTAGLTMSLGVRTMLQASTLGFGTALSMATNAYIFMFFAAYWSYGFIWEPIQVGNMLESERIRQQNEVLKQARIDISQGDFQKGAHEILNLYFENNPEDLRLLELQIAQHINEHEFKNFLSQKNSLRINHTEQENHYFGLLSQMALALKENDLAKIQMTRNLLIQLIQKDQKLDQQKLQELSAQGLLMFSVAHPPVYTSANAMISWLTTWIGAVGSTILAIPLSVILTTQSLMSDPIFIGKWIAASIALYGVSYLALSKKMNLKYIDFYKTKVASTKVGQLINQLSSEAISKYEQSKNQKYQKENARLIDEKIYNSQSTQKIIMRCEKLFI
ncbi:MAG: hypothetical protein ACK4VO_02680 [Pseudobdellovibrio sp.]